MAATWLVWRRDLGTKRTGMEKSGRVCVFPSMGGVVARMSVKGRGWAEWECGGEGNVIGSEGWWAIESEEGGGKGVDHN